MEGYYKIAGLNVWMDTFGRTLEQAKPYRCAPTEPDIRIESHWQILQQQQPHLSAEDSEYLSTGGSFYRQLLKHDGMLLHSSAVAMDGKAYLFSASCGTGKSTHTKLWLEKFGERAMMLNDDKPALRLENGVWYAYGTPWSGKYDISANIGVPIAGIAMIERGTENEIKPFGGAAAVFRLMEQTARPGDTESRIKILELLDKLLTMVPVWKLRCNMDPEAAIVSYETMSGRRKE